MAVPGSDLTHMLYDPIAVIASSSSLGLLIEEAEVPVVIDRDDTDYYDRSFFAYVDSSGFVSIRRMDGGFGDAAPEGYTIVGRVAVIHLPYDPKTMGESNTWLEDQGEGF